MTLESSPFTPHNTSHDAQVLEDYGDVKAFDDRRTDEPTLQEAFRQLSEQLRDRIETAADDCELERTPETEQAIKGYYLDHYKTAMIVDRIIEGEQIDPVLLADDATTLESFQLTESLHQIITEPVRNTQLEQLNTLISEKLFAEAAVGQTTITDQELSLLLGLNQKLQDKAKAENMFIRYPFSDDQLIERVERKTRLFWEDSRAAGQLEFHNTPFADQAAMAGFKLRTKPNQLKANGDYNSVTADVAGHSQTIHFSETFLSDSYKSIQAGKRVDEVTIGGTIAIPLAEIIKQLPYARGGEYGIAELKVDASHGPNIIDNANIFAFGGSHMAWADDTEPKAHGDDRTFYADKYDRQKGEDYALDFGWAMKTPAGNASHIIFLQRDIDIAHRKQYARDASNVDQRIDFGSGEGHPVVDVLEYDYGAPSFSENQPLKEGETFVDRQYHGYSANGLGLVDPRLERVATEHMSYREGVTAEQQEQGLRDAIKEIQRKSRELPQYKGKLVVMLRGGTMAYRPNA